MSKERRLIKSRHFYIGIYNYNIYLIVVFVVSIFIPCLSSITRNRYLALKEFAKWNGLGIAIIIVNNDDYYLHIWFKYLKNKGLWHSIVVYFFSYALFASNASFKYEGTVLILKKNLIQMFLIYFF